MAGIFAGIETVLNSGAEQLFFEDDKVVTKDGKIYEWGMVNALHIPIFESDNFDFLNAIRYCRQLDYIMQNPNLKYHAFSLQVVESKGRKVIELALYLRL